MELHHNQDRVELFTLDLQMKENLKDFNSQQNSDIVDPSTSNVTGKDKMQDYAVFPHSRRGVGDEAAIELTQLSRGTIELVNNDAYGMQMEGTRHNSYENIMEDL